MIFTIISILLSIFEHFLSNKFINEQSLIVIKEKGRYVQIVLNGSNGLTLFVCTKTVCERNVPFALV